MKSMSKFLTLTMALFVVTGIILWLVLIIFNQNSVDGVASFSQFFEQQKLMFTGFRVVLVATIFWQWERLINWLANFHRWEEKMRSTVIDSRWPILGWFVFFEIIVNQNLIGYLLN